MIDDELEINIIELGIIIASLKIASKITSLVSPGVTENTMEKLINKLEAMKCLD